MKSGILAVMILSGLGLGFGILLALFSKKFQVHGDFRVSQIRKMLPGINCGACGFPGCDGLAEALVGKKAEISVCVSCPIEKRKAINELLGLTSENLTRSISKISVIACGGGARCKDKFKYKGIADCRVAALTMGGHKECKYACLGQGTCVLACPYGAIVMQEDGIPKVIPERCVGCKKCVSACPRNIIFMNERDKKVYIKCKSHDKGPQVMKKCKVGCITCSKCVTICPVKAITIVENLARIDYKKCVTCKKCIDVCPTKAINLV